MKTKILSILSILLFFTSACNSQQVDVNPEKFNQLINEDKNAVVLDVRTPEEYNSGYIKDAKSIDYRSSDFENEVNKLDKNKTYYVYCLSGGRSGSAVKLMQKNGFKNVVNLDGGILAWNAKALPLTQTNSTAVADKISMEQYQQMISSDTLVLVDFYAPWCGPCLKMKPMLEDVAQEYAGKVKVIRLNIDENKQLAKTLNVVKIPILKIFEKGKEKWVHNGYIEKAELIKQL
ncbi:MAG: thioredoxin domain-containing protein [Chitinophagales bacterium]|nr:thioredoxin [Bacteroidota bacterium]